MGKNLLRCLLENRVEGLELAGAIDLWDCPDLDKDAGLAAGVAEAGVPITSDLAKVAPETDVVIDFTSHHGTVGNCPRCAEWNTAVVIGTTGISAEEQQAIEESAKTIPIVLAPNMSLGMNLLFALVEDAARALSEKGYDCEIIERHHRRKKDAPSGTALGLGQAAARGLEWDLDEVAVHGREGMVGERPDKEIGFHAVRGGDIVGDHTVLFATDGEHIELSHRATSRETFAMGALRAAAWIANQEPGLYSMQDVLGIKRG
jgi:4-hydroxy-tetrahydrodipicolinate reductase